MEQWVHRGFQDTLSIPLNGFQENGVQAWEWRANFQFHWMDSPVELIKQRLESISFNSIEWILCRKAIDLAREGNIFFQFHWMDSKQCGDAWYVEYVAGLSIPLNGFRLLHSLQHQDMPPAFNSIEWILYYVRGFLCWVYLWSFNSIEWIPP